MMAWTRVVAAEGVRRGQILYVFQSRARGFADELDEGKKKEKSHRCLQGPQPQKGRWPGNLENKSLKEWERGCKGMVQIGNRIIWRTDKGVSREGDNGTHSSG